MDRLHRIWVVLILLLCFLVPFAGVHGAVEEGKNDPLGLIDVNECKGVEVTQCELAKNLIMTLKMGEDLTCEACFIHLQALAIAPGEDWSYEDPHKVVTMEEMKEVLLEIHQAYNDGNVRFDGFEVAVGINSFCRDIKGPSATPPPREKEEKEAETQPASPSQEPQDQSPPSEEAEGEENTPTSGPPESDMQKEESE